MGADTRRGENAFIPYPTDRVVGTIEDATDVRGAIDALSEPASRLTSSTCCTAMTTCIAWILPAKTTDFSRGFSGRWSAWAGPVGEYQHLARHVDDVPGDVRGTPANVRPERRHNPRR